MLTRANFESYEIRAVGWMSHYGMFFLRFGLGVVFIWFGALKPFDMSPARQLVLDSTGWIPIPHFIYVLGVWEIVIGICFLYKPLLRLGLILLFLHMPGTALPFFLCPSACFVTFPFGLTLEGQYIIKNLVLVGAALVIGGTIRHRVSGFARFSPSELIALMDRGVWNTVEAGTELVTQGVQPKGIYFIKEGVAEVYVNDKWVANLNENHFVGEISFLTGQGATATVRSKGELRYLHWTTEDLKKQIKAQPHLAEALYSTFSLDLVSKLRRRTEPDIA